MNRWRLHQVNWAVSVFLRPNRSITTFFFQRASAGDGGLRKRRSRIAEGGAVDIGEVVSYSGGDGGSVLVWGRREEAPAAVVTGGVDTTGYVCVSFFG